MLNFKKYLPLLMVIGLCILVFIFLNEKKDYVADYNNKIELLESEVDFLKDKNKNLNTTISKLKLEIEYLDKEISIQDNRIEFLIKKTNEKVNNVNFFNNGELEQFFTNRYRHVVDSIENSNSTISN